MRRLDTCADVVLIRTQRQPQHHRDCNGVEGTMTWKLSSPISPRYRQDDWAVLQKSY